MQKTNTSYIRSKIDKLIAFGLFFLVSSYSYADAICMDGWWSKSKGSGTCSWHGGVKRWLPDGTITLWQFLIILGIALVIFIIIRKNSSKSNSNKHTKTTYRAKTKKTSTSHSLPKNPASPLRNEENVKFEPMKSLNFSKVIIEVEREFVIKLEMLTNVKKNDADFVSSIAQRLFFEKFMTKGFDEKEVYRALYALVDSSPLFLYLFRFKFDRISKDYQADKLSGLYSCYITERSSGNNPEEALKRATIEYFTGGSFDL